jgi:gluconokinase
LKQTGLGHSIYLETGTPIHSMSPLTKLIWMREEDPHTFASSAKFISIKEYVLYRLYGIYVVDYSIASATGLFNLRQLKWDDRALQTAGIRADQLSMPVPTTYILTGMNAKYAAAIGIHLDLPVVIGASDGALANLGVGAIAPGQVSLTVGTSGAIRRVMPEPVLDSQGRTFCYYLTDHHWVIGGPTNNGGVALQWFINQFCTGESVDSVIHSARDIKPGADGLLFLPFLLGERAPYWNPDARGNFFGIALQHQKAHFARAVLEGVMFSLYSVGKVLSELTEEITEIRATGGFARSDLWTNILADVFGSTVLNPASHESSSIGAAMLAMLAIGKVNSLEEAVRVISIKQHIEPNPQHHEVYQELHGIYERIYTKLEEEFKLISEYQKKI